MWYSITKLCHVILICGNGRNRNVMLEVFMVEILEILFGM